MRFLKHLINRHTFRDVPDSNPVSSFEHLSLEQFETHLRIRRYGDFILTDAVRPSYDLQVVPRAGFRHDQYVDPQHGIRIPVIMAAASQEILLDLFVDLLDPLGEVVDVVLETSHRREGDGHDDLVRESIDLPILKSIIYEFEDVILNDGCAGLAVLNSRIPLEVQLDEHKLLVLYGHDQAEFERILRRYGVQCDEELQFITEAEHVHSSSDELFERFCELSYRLGIDEQESLPQSL